MIVVLEGIDGSGKTTLAKRLSRDIGFNYIHFPVDVDLTLPHDELQQAMADDLLKNAPVMQSGDWVVDRFWQSSYAYGMPTSMLLGVLSDLPEYKSLSIYFDIPALVSLTRCLDRGNMDKFDKAPIEERQRLIKRYSELQWDCVIDANRPLGAVYQTLLATVLPQIGL